MKIRNPFRNKVICAFCEKDMGFFHSVHEYGIYGTELGTRIFYHPECYKNVMCNPEISGTRNVDMALNISNLKEKNQLENEDQIKTTREKILALKVMCGEENGEQESGKTEEFNRTD